MRRDFDAILVTADEPYEGPWHTQLIYTEYLALQTHVFFFNPPSKWKIQNLFGFGLKEKKISENLTVIYYRNILPVFSPLSYRINERYNERLVKGKLKKENIHSILLWQFDSFRNCFDSGSFLKDFVIKRIYHVIDPFMSNPKNDLLSRLADLLIITSSRNNKYYLNHNQKLINIPQVINLSYSEMLLNGPLTQGLQLPEKFLVLLGTISEDVDFEWLFHLVKNPSVNLLIIGKTSGLTEGKEKFDLLSHMPNVRYLGLMSPVEFYPVLKKASAGLVVYSEEKMKKVFSSLKAINYLLANIPVITNINSEIDSLNNKCIFNVDNVQELESIAKLALESRLKFDALAAKEYLNSISIADAVNTILSKI